MQFVESAPKARRILSLPELCIIELVRFLLDSDCWIIADVVKQRRGYVRHNAVNGCLKLTQQMDFPRLGRT